MRRRMMSAFGGGSGGGIPPGWVEVEYIESTGTQYIDTGVSWDASLKISAKFSPRETATIAMYCLWGGRDTQSGSQGNCFGLSNTGKFRSDNNGYRTTSSSSYSIGGVYSVVKNGANVVITGDASETMSATLRAGSGSAKIALFGMNEEGVFRYQSKFSCFAFEIVGRLKFVPVYNPATGEGAMCDILTGDIYHNAGKGAFIVGPDK